MKSKLSRLNSRLLAAAVLAGSCGSAVAGWSQDALNLQYQLQKHTPITQSNIIGTHNSYSSNAYDMELYENQNLSITQQLEQGSRFLELDLWRNTKVEYVSVILCHNGGRCDIESSLITGLLPDDYIYLDSALVEIADWAKKNRDQIIVIKLEDQMADDEYHYFEEAIQRTIGDIVYRPQRTSADEGCKSFPADLTPAEMLDQGKQIIFKGYSGASCNPIGRSWVFQSTNPERDSEAYKNYGHEYRACSVHGGGRYALFYDDAAEGDPAADGVMPDSAVRPLMKCGGTVFGFDWLKTDDNRIAEAVWSWAPDQPDNKAGNGSAAAVDCAVSYNGRFYDDSCGLNFAYSCSDGNRWKITSAEGAWQNGQAVCRAEFGNAFDFDVPRTSKQNQALESAKIAAQKTAAWLNYSEQSNGAWLSGADLQHAANLNENTGLKVQSWNDYKWVYSDAGTGGDNNLSVWRAQNLTDGWYSLGDVAGLATSGPRAYTYSRKPGSSLVAFDDGSGKLAKPVSYDWRWNDWKTGGDTDVTFWQPVAPVGYTCLGSIAVASQSRTQPDTNLMRCVRDDQLIESSSLWEWSDAGSGGAYDATAYLNSYFNGASVPAGATANTGLSPNTFIVNPKNFDRFRVLDSRVVNWLNGPLSLPSQRASHLCNQNSDCVSKNEYRELRVNGKCLDFEGSVPANGKKAVIWDCSGVAWQKWKYDSLTGLLHNKADPSYCLDHAGWSNNGARPHMWQCASWSNNQKWNFTGKLIAPKPNSNLTLDAFGTENGAAVGLWQRHGGANQQWSWN
ncbi:phosphatidylinositol-specific phospholipase C domain-containing protein [Bacterioplanoides sp.]|uniref:phosphatidylinositol-specific phospholipase C domain-containing protein n=1 Tax=Bacterioplanoides sp. TaxID=2066072 RepID=UPI003B5C5039